MLKIKIGVQLERVSIALIFHIQPVNPRHTSIRRIGRQRITVRNIRDITRQVNVSFNDIAQYRTTQAVFA